MLIQVQVNGPPPSSLYLAPIRSSKNSKKLLFLFSNKTVAIRAGHNKMLVRIANREGPDQAASSSEAV